MLHFLSIGAAATRARNVPHPEIRARVRGPGVRGTSIGFKRVEADFTAGELKRRNSNPTADKTGDLRPG
ncbi:MAG: hypothetical protein CMJ81_01530 [Planctomycetaceae bacterium]|jgi:hypothetical protein|nr:hypothetical protein [Planctomycetaceae bacterium]